MAAAMLRWPPVMGRGLKPLRPAARGRAGGAGADGAGLALTLPADGDRGGVARLELGRPPVNALGRGLAGALRAAVEALRRAGPARVRCTVVHSAVPGVFCAGADLKERRAMGEAETLAFVRGLRGLFNELEALPHPTVAVLNGAALGGGLELALACDLRVAAAGAALGLPETRLAIIPGAGGTQRLPAVVGLAKAKELIFTGRRVDAHEALAMGLVNRVAGTEAEALDLALELAGEIAAGGPLGVRMAKRALHRGHEAGPEAGLQAEDECYQVVLESADRREALRAFAAKEAPVFAGK